MTTIILTALVAFVIGFLLGDRRGVRQCNAILDDHLQTLLKGMMEEKPLQEALREEQPTQPTLH